MTAIILFLLFILWFVAFRTSGKKRRKELKELQNIIGDIKKADKRIDIKFDRMLYLLNVRIRENLLKVQEEKNVIKELSFFSNEIYDPLMRKMLPMEVEFYNGVILKWPGTDRREIRYDFLQYKISITPELGLENLYPALNERIPTTSRDLSKNVFNDFISSFNKAF